MQIYYSNIKTKGEQSITQNERREMRNAIVDYGALQPSPVHSSSSNEGGILGKLKLQYAIPASSAGGSIQNAATVQTPATLPSLQNSPMPNQSSPLPTRRSPSPTAESPNRTQNIGQQHQFQTLELDFLSPGFDMFEMDFNINDGDLESAIADAAQGFWTDFPGEVEVI
jgi:hypothetical protein